MKHTEWKECKAVYNKHFLKKPIFTSYRRQQFANTAAYQQIIQHAQRARATHDYFGDINNVPLFTKFGSRLQYSIDIDGVLVYTHKCFTAGKNAV